MKKHLFFDNEDITYPKGSNNLRAYGSFYFRDIYDCYIFRDDKAEYIGIGIEKHGHFAVNYYYPNCTDFGVAHYIFD